MKKLLLTMILSAICALNVSNSAHAASFSLPVAEDMMISSLDQFNTYHNMNLNYVYNHRAYQTTYYTEPGKEPDLHTVMLKFDFSNNTQLQTALSNNQSIVSITLNVFNHDTFGQAKTGVYYTTWDTWFESPPGYNPPLTMYAVRAGAFDTAIADTVKPSNRVGEVPSTKAKGGFFTSSRNDEWVATPLDITALVSDDNNILSFMLYNDNQLPDIQTGDTFWSKEHEDQIYTPYLTIETAPTPAPEPTTMLLGLMGIAGAARLKRKA